MQRYHGHVEARAWLPLEALEREGLERASLRLPAAFENVHPSLPGPHPSPRHSSRIKCWAGRWIGFSSLRSLGRTVLVPSGIIVSPMGHRTRITNLTQGYILRCMEGNGLGGQSLTIPKEACLPRDTWTAQGWKHTGGIKKPHEMAAASGW